MARIHDVLNSLQSSGSDTSTKTVSITLKKYELEQLKKIAKKYKLSLSRLIGLVIKESKVLEDEKNSVEDNGQVHDNLH